MIILVYKGYNQKPRNWKYPHLEFSQVFWRLEQARDTKFGMNVSIEKLFNAVTDARFTVFTISE